MRFQALPESRRVFLPAAACALALAVFSQAAMAQQATSAKPAPLKAAAPAQRTFRFIYEATFSDLPAGELRVWIPAPRESAFQAVTLIEQSPPDASLETDEATGNRMYFFERAIAADAPPERRGLSAKFAYEITRREVRSLETPEGETRPSAQELSATEREKFLAEDKLVPTGGKSLELIANVRLSGNDPLQLGRQLYNRVNEHMRYDKSGEGWGRGDSNWACDSRYGNCTDFHSVFMSLARANGLPAKFEMGFPLPPKETSGEIPGYHCWAWFHASNNGWTPVDISEADKHPEFVDYYFGNLTADRVAFTTGRDLTLVPEQSGGPLNFFIYPYAELSGKPLDAKHVTKKFSFEETPSAGAR